MKVVQRVLIYPHSLSSVNILYLHGVFAAVNKPVLKHYYERESTIQFFCYRISSGTPHYIWSSCLLKFLLSCGSFLDFPCYRWRDSFEENCLVFYRMTLSWNLSDFLKFIFNWRVIALQNCVGFYQTSRWISCRFTHVPSLHSPIPPL